MKLALLQICSKLDPAVNLKKIHSFIDEIKKEAPETEAVVLPEVFYSMSDGTSPTPHLVESDNYHFHQIRDIAVKNSIAVIGGSAATKINGKIYNRSYNFDKDGSELAIYDKIHLFRIDLKSSENIVVIDEGKTYSAGNDLKSFEFNGLNFGITICFDLRFPEIFREYFHKGCNAFLVSSAFTKATGKAHWETLLKARAIENQSYVIACNQWGKHNEKLTSYGHSMIIDPWGEVIANAGEGEKYVLAELDVEKLKKVRTRMKMQKQFLT